MPRSVPLPSGTTSVEYARIVATADVTVEAGLGPMTLDGIRFDLAPLAAMNGPYTIDTLYGLSAANLAFLFVSQALGTKPASFVRQGNYIERDVLVGGSQPYSFVRDGLTKTLRARVPALSSPFFKVAVYYGYPSLVRFTGSGAPSSLSEAA